jgi:predicted nucleic acid-binding protein
MPVRISVIVLRFCKRIDNVTKWVIDANVAIKWVLPEIHSDTALSILDNDDDQLLVPDFFFSEITNILWKRIQRDELSLTDAKESLKSIQQVDFEIFSSYDLVAQALEISVEVKQAIYDCIYLALAIDNEAEILYGIAILPAGAKRQLLHDTAQAMFTEDFASKILPFCQESAEQFAIVAAHRRNQGKPISQLDAQIAAICRTHQATIATRNVNDFTDCHISVTNPWDS